MEIVSFIWFSQGVFWTSVSHNLSDLISAASESRGWTLYRVLPKWSSSHLCFTWGSTSVHFNGKAAASGNRLQTSKLISTSDTSCTAHILPWKAMVSCIHTCVTKACSLAETNGAFSSSLAKLSHFQVTRKLPSNWNVGQVPWYSSLQYKLWCLTLTHDEQLTNCVLSQ